MTDIAAELESIYGPDPSAVGAEDGTEDDFGDLICEAVQRLGYSLEELSDEAWQHVQGVAAASQTTTMTGWLAAVEAALAQT